MLLLKYIMVQYNYMIGNIFFFKSLQMLKYSVSVSWFHKLYIHTVHNITSLEQQCKQEPCKQTGLWFNIIFANTHYQNYYYYTQIVWHTVTLSHNTKVKGGQCHRSLWGIITQFPPPALREIIQQFIDCDHLIQFWTLIYWSPIFFLRNF